MDQPLDIIALFDASRPFLAFLLLFIMGIIQVAKKLGLKGWGCVALSVGLGILMGFGFFWASFGIPSTREEVYMAILISLAPGLAASGAFDLGRDAGREVLKLAADAIGRLARPQAPEA
jgi:hypothetical protein